MKILCVDIETTGLEQWSELLVISAAYLDSPLDVKHYTLVEIIDEIISNDCHVSMHNGFGFDLPWMIYNERLQGEDRLYTYLCKTKRVIDTILVSRLCYPQLMKHTLKSWVPRLQHEYTYLHDKVTINDWSEANIEKITDRNIKDVYAQCAITKHFITYGCMESQEVKDYHSAVKFNLDLSLNGIPFDHDQAKNVYASRILKANRELLKVEEVLGRINVGSNTQLDAALKRIYGKGLPLGEPSKKTKKCSPLFNKKNARFVVKDFPVLKYVLNYREAMTIAKFVEPINSDKSYHSRYKYGKVFPNVNLIKARTLRASYQKPPLQQFPDDMKALITGDIIDMDFSGLEMQVLAYTLKEQFGENTLWNMAENGICPKQATADCLGSLLDNIPEENKLSVSKTVNYAVLFGQQAKNTLNVLQLDRSYETELKQALDKRFPALSLFTKHLQRNMKNGCILNLFNQRTSSPEYCVINTFTQSSGALYAMKLLPLVYKYLSPKLKVLAFIHDEMLLEQVEDITDEEINEAIENAYIEFEHKHKFPIISKLNWKRENTWLEAH